MVDYTHGNLISDPFKLAPNGKERMGKGNEGEIEGGQLNGTGASL